MLNLVTHVDRKVVMVAVQKKASDEKTVKAPGDFGYFSVMANVANARLSTGPRTAEGKARSSQNALKHGFRAINPLLDEDPDKIEKEHALFVQSFGPRNAAAKAAVDLAFRSKRQLERILGAEDARIALIQDRFNAKLLRDRVRFVEKGKLEFDVEPAKGVAFLTSTLLGIDTLIRLVEDLGKDLERGVWTPGHSAKLLAAEENEAIFDTQLDAFTAITDRIVAARATLNRTDPDSPLDREERLAATKSLEEAESAVRRFRPILAGRINQACTRLVNQRHDALQTEAAQVRRMMDSIKVDDSHESALLNRYKSQALRDFHRAMQLAAKLCGYNAATAESPLCVPDSSTEAIYKSGFDRMNREQARRAPNEPESDHADYGEDRDRPGPGTNVRDQSGR